MMEIRLICFGLLFSYLICHTDAQFTCNSIEGYNTKDLTSASQWQVTTDYQCLSNLAADCTYYLSFCQPAPSCFREYSACENATGATNMTIIGAVSPNLFHENESGPKGFYAKFPQGPLQNISNTTYCAPSLIVKFRCNLKALWLAPISEATAFAPEPYDIDIDPKDPCLTIMYFDYAGACYYGEEPSKGISGGAVFLIILFSVALVYFAIGVGYNGLVKHRSGINLLPQAQFWIGLPLFAIEGCRSTITCCSGTPRPNPATYESV